MHALEVHPTCSIRVIEDGNEAIDQPELVFAIPVATGDTLGDVVLVGD